MLERADASPRGDGLLSERCVARSMPLAEASAESLPPPRSEFCLVKVGKGVSAGATPLPAILLRPSEDVLDGHDLGASSHSSESIGDAAEIDEDELTEVAVDEDSSGDEQQPQTEEQSGDESERADEGFHGRLDNNILAGSRTTVMAAAAAAAAPMKDVSRRVRFSVETTLEAVKPVQSALTPSDIGEMRFYGFTAFIIALFLMAFLTDMFIILTHTYSEENDIGGIPAYSLVLNYIWIALQAALFVDVLISYVRFLCPTVRRRLRRLSLNQDDVDPGNDPARKKKNKAKFMGSSFSQPYFWAFFVRCFRLEEFQARSYLLILAVLLPFNTLLVYEGLGYPVYTPSMLEDVDIDAFMNNATFPVGANMILDTATWVLTIGGTREVTITSRHCYSYESGEFRLLSRLRNEDIAKQAYCESTVGSMLAEWATDTGQASWRQDDDVWEEAFIFLVRLFGSLAGVVADQTHQDVGNRFLRDMTDVFDMYMFTFADVAQMLEGRPLLEGSHALFGEVFRRPYHRWVMILLMLAYATIFFRALGIVGWRPAVTLIRKCGSAADDADLQVLVDAALGLLVVDLPFLTLRWVAWWFYLVPVSLMCVKNVFAIVEAFYILGLVKGFTSHEQRRGIWLCCKRRISGSSGSDSSD